MSSYVHAAALVAALAGSASAHGFVQGVTSGNKYYESNPTNWYYQDPKPDLPGWYANNQDSGFVDPTTYETSDIACHINATVGSTSIPVTAGSTIMMHWNTWPESHVGPVLDYLACLNGEFSSATADGLSFVKIAEAGYDDENTGGEGTWASSELLANNISWAVKIPDSANGNCVLRHEIIALHAATQENGAQNYPQCINLKITGGSDGLPSGQKATTFYTATDAGITANVYSGLTKYSIPGPDVMAAGSSGGSSSAAPSSASTAAASSASEYSSAAASSASQYSSSAAASSTAAASSASEYSSVAAASSTAAASSASGYSAAASSTAAASSASEYSSAAAASSTAAASSASAYPSAKPSCGSSPNSDDFDEQSADIPDEWTYADYVAYAMYLLKKASSGKGIHQRDFRA